MSRIRTVAAEKFFDTDQKKWYVRHIYHDTKEKDRRCTAFYPVNSENQAEVLVAAITDRQ